MRNIRACIEKIKQEIIDLRKKYEGIEATRCNSISERDVAGDFVEPLFDALGWHTRNPNEYQREYPTTNGYIDAVIKIDGKDAILIETKRFNKISKRYSNSLISASPEEEQLLNNVRKHGKGIKYAILTNFEKFRLFDTFNNRIVLDIEDPYQYLIPENFEIFIGLCNESLFTFRKLEDRINHQMTVPETKSENTAPELEKFLKIIE